MDPTEILSAWMALVKRDVDPNLFLVPGTMAQSLEDWISMEPLWDKAIQSPSEITQEQKHQIAEWPSLEEMQENVQKYLGGSLEELFQKAATDPESLTYPECRLIRDDFHILTMLDSVKYNNDRFGWEIRRRDLKEKREKACAVVLSADEWNAVQNVKEPEFFVAKQQSGFDAWNKAHPRSRDSQWVQMILNREEKTWGYVIYHPAVSPDDRDAVEAWEEFQSRFKENLSFHPVRVTGGDQIRDSKVTEFVPFDQPEGDIDQLRQEFRNSHESGSLKTGVLPHVFLLINDECQNSYKTTEFPWMWAIDPDWSQSLPDEDGYDGRVKTSWGQLYNKFYDFMSTNRFTLKQVWQDFNQLNAKFPDRPRPAWLYTELGKPVWPHR